MKSNKSLFIVVNVDWFFLSHRLPIALRALKEGYNVTIVARDTGKTEEIRRHGLQYVDAPISRSGISFFYEIKTLFYLFRLYIKSKPDLVHHVSLKISIYGSIAARFAKINGIINAISGLGYMFTSGRKSNLNRILDVLMLIAFKGGRNKYYIFQNQDDYNYFREKGVLKRAKSKIIKGSGVDLNKFSYCPPKANTKLKILLSARMLYDKGVVEFTKAAQILYLTYKDQVEFILAGPLDYENPAAINEKDLLGLLLNGYISWIGNRKDILEVIRESDIVVLPSYREGLPKSLIEACAVGRPIVTTSAIGCKECVIDGENGYLVPIKDEIQLAEKIKILIKNPDIRLKMGIASRKLAEKEFSLDDVINSTIDIYKELEKHELSTFT